MTTVDVPSPAVDTFSFWDACRTAVRYLPDVAVVCALAWWATYLTWGVGGRQAHVLSTGLVLSLLATFLVRPWTRLGSRELALTGALAVAPFLVVATSPTGWAGIHEAGSYLHAVMSYLLVRTWAWDHTRRLLVLVGVVAAGGLEFAQGWLPWWGGEDPTTPFWGTFHYYNQTGIFLAASAVAGAGLAVRGPRNVRLLTWVIVPLCLAGVVFTTSRGSQIGLGLGLVMLMAVTMRRAARWPGPLTVAVLAAAGLILSWVLVRPPFFPHAASPFTSTAARADSFQGNGTQRLEDWRRGWEIFKHWPLSGAGFHSFAAATDVATTRHDSTVTAFAHNGYVQAASDGGVVLATPVFLAVALLLLAITRRLWRRDETIGTAAAMTSLILLLHSGMDFDWTYPALLTLVAVAAALVVSPTDVRISRSMRYETAWMILFGALAAVAAVGAWHGGMDLNSPLGGTR